MNGEVIQKKWDLMLSDSEKLRRGSVWGDLAKNFQVATYMDTAFNFLLRVLDWPKVLIYLFRLALLLPSTHCLRRNGAHDWGQFLGDKLLFNILQDWDKTIIHEPFIFDFGLPCRKLLKTRRIAHQKHQMIYQLRNFNLAQVQCSCLL